MKKILVTLVLAAFIAQLYARPGQEETTNQAPVEEIKNSLYEANEAFSGGLSKAIEKIKEVISKNYKLTDEDFKKISDYAKYLNF